MEISGMEKSLKRVALAAALTLLAACGGGRGDSPASTASGAAVVAGSTTSPADAAPSASTGQVKPVASTKMSAYAAARAADQVSFGATTALVTDLAQSGLAAWVDAQMASPITKVNVPPWVIDYNRDDQTATRKAYRFGPESFFGLALTAPDQLRQRVSWALLQFVPVNGKVDPYGMSEHFSLLQRHAFGNYGAFLRELSVHPAMGMFLDNKDNRPLSAQCPNCAPNENYARELMQLFSLGVVKLNPDGTTQRDAQGKVIESYSQKDVEELARVLTGWRFAPSATLPRTNWINASQLMVPETSAAAHDRGAKSVLGTAFPAGRDAPQELDAAIAMLMAHPNIAPFVSLRMIQHLVTSNPTPQYVGRVAAAFRNNGQGVAGDMKAVIRAVLLDPEARLGDQPGADTPRFGKLREPVLFYTASLRGLGCTQPLVWNDGNLLNPPGQSPFSAPSVFSYYLPTDRAPGSNLLAPEQKLLMTDELTQRLGRLTWTLVDSKSNAASGCDVASMGQAFAQSPKALIDLVSARWFRGAMPPTLRSNLTSLATSQTWDSPDKAAFVLLQFALSTPYFGVIK
jgi:uncharacterized protein (DUF1800 family)